MPSPIVTATLQATALSSASNICAQIISAYQDKRPFSLDVIQFLRFVTLSLITAPPNYHWQQFLERTFPAYPSPLAASSRPSRRLSDVEMKPVDAALAADKKYDDEPSAADEPRFSLQNTLTKWFVDCITLGAIFNTVAFLVIMGFMKGQGRGQIWYNLQTETIPIIVAGYKIWPIASIISFSFVPVHRRIVFLSFVGLLWGIYMSLVAQRV
ncbi:hypothetical protein ACRALDRAFT_2093926 [Sodiomyces alcalophilus JCM 7366]|uniref:uncharacterized protein n=1 Tax=Sodiomyces alcalophilus JCM 7366 TaxID=591952 RepID=UPI0039B46BAE